MSVMHHPFAALDEALSEMEGETAKERRERNRRENQAKRPRAQGKRGDSDTVQVISTTPGKPPLETLYRQAGLPMARFRAFGDWLQAQHGPSGHAHLTRPADVLALWPVFLRRFDD